MPGSRKTIVVSLALAAALVAAAWISFGALERYFLRQLAGQNEATLRLVSAGLDGALRRYDPLPGLIADKETIRQLLSGGASVNDFLAINTELKRIALEVGASDLYVMDASGLTIAASNYDLETSFVGRNFSFRPYFSGAIDGHPTRYFALGTTSLKRGYYFSSPVRDNGRVLGVVVLKIEVDALEESWRGPDTAVIVADKYGVIFMASQPDWLFKSLGPLDDTIRGEIKKSRRYPVERLGELAMKTLPSGVEGSPLRAISSAGRTDTLLSSARKMPEAGWTLHVLTPARTATASAAAAMAVALLATLLAGLIAGIVYQRRRQLILDFERQRRSREELKLRVEERTRDLNNANRQLQREVSERTQAEEQLRSTQNELIQAGKLAALGQMSAALSHELNQPLAAIKSYAENARAYLKLDKTGQATDNIGRISEMADRMAEFGRHLRNFARKPKQKIDVVNLAEVFAAVSQIMGARLKETGAELQIAPLKNETVVMGGSVRLQQVIINLINNALDAMAGMPEQHIEVTTTACGGKIEISVRDHGPGLEQSTADQIFDPFFTSKDVNEGLGLGLSISYNIVQDFGGSLRAANHPDGGAVFTVSLVDANSVRSAAE